MYPHSCEIRRAEISASGPSVRLAWISGSTLLSAESTERSIGGDRRLERGLRARKCDGGSGFSPYAGRHSSCSWTAGLGTLPVRPFGCLAA
ncbi:unnamed protein product [Lasius platythorax]|uniref:Uncharacterized protein n=1 Tax=Lasius platythorax TaxID=488582 RepID=A0AAV2NTP3_9HYME